MFSPEINPSNILISLDYFVFFLTITLTLTCVFLAFRVHRVRHLSEEASLLEYLLMGRQLTLPLFVGTLVATWYGGIFGVTQLAFEKGLYNFLTQGIFWYISYIIFAFFLTYKVHSTKSKTMPELVGKLFGPKSAKLTAIFNFFDVLPITYAMSLGVFLQVIFGGNLQTNTCLGMTLVVSYSLLGGFRAVIFSDIVQFFVMCLAVFSVLFFSYTQFGGLTFLQANIPENHWSFLGGESYLDLMIWGFIALSTLVDPSFYQRCLAAKSPKIARNGILISTCVWICFDICTTFGALYARAIIPEAESNQAYLIYSLQVLPAGFRGLFLAGIIATILSTLDSYLFIAGTSISYDLLPKKWFKKIPTHHLSVIFTGILSTILSEFFEGNIRLVCKILGSYAAACLLLPIILGFASPGTISDKQFVKSSLFGVFSMTLWSFGNFTLDRFYIGCICTGSALLYQQIMKRYCKTKIN